MPSAQCRRLGTFIRQVNECRVHEMRLHTILYVMYDSQVLMSVLFQSPGHFFFPLDWACRLVCSWNALFQRMQTLLIFKIDCWLFLSVTSTSGLLAGYRRLIFTTVVACNRLQIFWYFHQSQVHFQRGGIYIFLKYCKFLSNYLFKFIFSFPFFKPLLFIKEKKYFMMGLID